MALGKKNRTSDLTAYSLKIKTKDAPAPFFEVKKREGDKWSQIDNTDAVSGTIVSVEPKENKWDGKIIKSVSLNLIENGEIYFVTIPYSNLGRGLMNSLLSLETFDNVEISLYQTKPKEGQTKTYPAASLRQKGELVRWKFSNDQLPSPEEVIFKGEKMRDFSKQEEFFAAQLVELNNRIQNNSTSAASTPVLEAEVDNESGDGDVPF